MRHRGSEPVGERELIEAIARTPSDHYVIWTGELCNSQPGSLRSRALACITEVGQAVPLRTVMRRAAGLDLNPDAVRNAVRMHQMARPTVYLLGRRLSSGELVAVADIAFATAGARRINAGAALTDRQGRLLPPLETLRPRPSREPLQSQLEPT